MTNAADGSGSPIRLNWFVDCDPSKGGGLKMATSYQEKLSKISGEESMLRKFGEGFDWGCFFGDWFIRGLLFESYPYTLILQKTLFTTIFNYVN